MSSHGSSPTTAQRPAEAATGTVAEQLEVPDGAPLIVLRQLIVDRHDRPVHLALTRYVGGRFVLDLDQQKHVYADPAGRDQDTSYEIAALS